MEAQAALMAAALGCCCRWAVAGTTSGNRAASAAAHGPCSFATNQPAGSQQRGRQGGGPAQKPRLAGEAWACAKRCTDGGTQRRRCCATSWHRWSVSLSSTVAAGHQCRDPGSDVRRVRVVFDGRGFDPARFGQEGPDGSERSLSRARLACTQPSETLQTHGPLSGSMVITQ